MCLCIHRNQIEMQQEISHVYYCVTHRSHCKSGIGERFPITSPARDVHPPTLHRVTIPSSEVI